MMANETLRTSTAGLDALRRREGAVLHYYNDSASHCTYGVGTLAHYGPCTPDELRRSVTIAQVNADLAVRVGSAERTVRQRVRNQTLTQEQFDALVSFTFNTGAGGARATLDAANRGAFPEVVSHMNNNIYVHARDASGHRLPAIRLPGLVNRRREEAVPFQTRQANP